MKVTKRELQLFDEIQNSVKCKHGFYRYANCWMKKTQKNAIEKGLLSVCKECTDEMFNYLKVNI